jgi:hypothetical protein
MKATFSEDIQRGIENHLPPGLGRKPAPRCERSVLFRVQLVASISRLY